MVRSWKWQGRRRRRPIGADRQEQAGAAEAPPARLLRAEPTSSREAGPSVLIRFEHRAVVIPADEAEAIAREILEAANDARRLPPQA